MRMVAIESNLGEPARPAAVPRDARWDFTQQGWVLASTDDGGELQGTVRFYFAEGALALEQDYRHGRRHGVFRRFHRSGALAQEGRYFDDALDGLSISHSVGDDPDSLRECCVPSGARTLKQEYRSGVPLAEAFFDVDGARIEGEEPAQELRERQDDVLAPAFEFWPGRESIPHHGGESVMVAQPLSVLRETITRAAQRLAAYRTVLLEAAPELAPPDVAPLVPVALPLRRLHLEPAGAEPVTVDEEPRLDTAPVRAIALSARLEWTALCWLCWAAGQDEVTLPAALTPPPELYAALLHASARATALRCHEDLRESGAFHGLDETVLPGSALRHLADHYREIRAVLLFVSDPECLSLWQDDLGREPLP